MNPQQNAGRRSFWRLFRLEERLTPTAGYLRIVDYNITASAGTGAPASGLDTLLQGMGNELLNGQSEPVDLLTIQEVKSQATTSQAVAALLNGIYGAGLYSASTINGDSTGSGTQGIVYNNQKLQLLTESKVGVADTSGQPRQALRYKMHPIGYSSSNDFYVYVSHTKSDVGTANVARREVEATALRADSDALGDGVNLIYTGDFNIYTSTESFYQSMLASGNGQAFDPISQPGSWHNTASFKGIFTQAPAVNPPGGLTGGGLDDRFDFQLFSGELTDGKGLDYVATTYHTFGNNGSVALNGNINDPSSTALPGLANRTTLLDLLTTVSDHLPVVADYRIFTPPRVQSVNINGGSIQRSMLNTVSVTFDGPVTFSGGAGAAANAFQLKRQSDNMAVTLNAAVAGNTVTLTFTGGAVDGASLADGRYTLTILSSNVSNPSGQLDGNADNLGGDNFVFASALSPATPTNIYRLFGDSSGDGKVDATDFGAFRAAFNSTGPNPPYNAAFDFNNDGKVDAIDFGFFRARFNTSI